MKETNRYLYNPGHKITVCVIGAGGTGSWVVGNLCMLHHYLVQTGRPGLKITIIDDDVVTEANVYRQGFMPCEIGEYKAIALAEKYNLAYGMSISCKVRKVTMEHKLNCNVVFSCVDNVKARRTIVELFKFTYKHRREQEKNLVLIDCGNSYNHGQVVVTTSDFKKHNFFYLYPDAVDSKNETSCSLLEAIGKQNLFVNKRIATYAVNWLYEAIRNTFYQNLGYVFSENSLVEIPFPDEPQE